MVELRDDPRYPAIKIYGLASLLADVSTDYAEPALLSLGLNRKQFAILTASARPLIEIYENEFFGIVVDELVRLQRKIAVELQRQKEDAAQVFQTLQAMSDGRGRFMWVPQLAWTDLRPIVVGKSPPTVRHSDPDAFAAYLELFRTIVATPEAHLDAHYRQAESDWRDGRRSAWDEEANRLIFGHLRIAPAPVSAARNANLRRLSKAVVERFEPAARKALHQDLLDLLSGPGFRRTGYDVASLPSHDEIASRSESEWRELLADLKAGFATRPGRA